MKILLTTFTLLISLSLFSQKTIVSTEKVGQAKDGSLCYVSREVVKFNQLNSYELTAIVREKLFKKEAEIDSLGSATGKILQVIVEDKGKTATSFPNVLVDNLFSSLGEDISTSDSFVTKFNNLQQKALLIYTKQINRYGSVNWEIKED